MMSAGAADAIPALEKLLEDENDAVRDEAKQALGWIRTG
jgi:HEAT repeat protein